MVINDTIREFLQKLLLARMSTIDSDGYPHTVPVWFRLDGEARTHPTESERLGAGGWR